MMLSITMDGQSVFSDSLVVPTGAVPSLIWSRSLGQTVYCTNRSPPQGVEHGVPLPIRGPCLAPEIGQQPEIPPAL
ncbi:MAG: hypothetical protein ICV75_00480 [Nitrospiraceae bacterium]|nr:hypothetical protein [Nitrospiraceae bacterium]